MPNDGPALVVTGASSGIGRALAQAASHSGYRVLMIARRSSQLEEIARSIRHEGGRCAVLVADVTAPQTPARIVEAALQAFGRIDVLVNNAGRGAYGSLLEQSDAEIEANWQLGVAGPLRIARAALAQLEKSRGHLVFIGSGIARVPLPQWGAYAVTKAAIRAAAIQLRRELRARGIAVTYVDPGVVATEFHFSSGIERSRRLPVSAERVARAMLRGIARRRAVVNAVPWQTAATALGEWSGTLADRVIVSRFAARPHPSAASAASHTAQRIGVSPNAAILSERSESKSSEAEGRSTTFEQALEPVARRMERVKLSQTFLRDALLPDATLELNTLAMRWAGMPNKNERAALREALDALAAAGYLEPMENETWKVVRAAD